MEEKKKKEKKDVNAGSRGRVELEEPARFGAFFVLSLPILRRDWVTQKEATVVSSCRP